MVKNQITVGINMLNKKEIKMWKNLFYHQSVAITVKNQMTHMIMSDGTNISNIPITFNGLVVELTPHFIYLVDDDSIDHVIAIQEISTIQTTTDEGEVDARLNPHEPIPDKKQMS